MLQTVVQLSNSISQAVANLQKVCADSGVFIPSLHENFTDDSELFRRNLEAAEAADLIVAASSQLIAILQTPSLSVLQAACAHIQSAALRVCLETNVVEILREAGDEGLHVTELAQKAGVEQGKLGRLMRYLSSHHIFRQIKPETYTNNRLSSLLDGKKSAQRLHQFPEEKYDVSSEQSFPALIELFSSDLHISSGYMAENLKDPVTGSSENPNHAPFNRAFNVDVPLFEWYRQPAQEQRLRRFMTAMEGTNKLQADDGLLEAINWKQLPLNSIIVDVGGGWGKATLPLARQNPHLQFVIQDKADMNTAGKKAWETEFGLSILDRVTFQVHDFFSPQPIKSADVFILKHVLHAFSDIYCFKILKHLREAAKPTTQLIIIDTLIPNNQPSEEGPFPIMDYDPTAEMAYLSDMTMMLQLNSQERTLRDLNSILESSGWKVTQVCDIKGHGHLLRPVTATPI